MLEIRDIHTYIGESYILQGVSMEIPKGNVVALLGRNGVGKTTLVSSIIGFRPIRTGSILLEGKEISTLPAHRIVRLGIGLVPQGRRIFSSLTVDENLEVPYKGPLRSERDFSTERVFQIFPALKERKDHRGGKLSGGEQQMLATARALMAHPRLLLMDEPSMGLAPVLVESVFETIQEINQEGTTVLLVEQNAHMALQVADRGYVLQTGEIVLKDSAKGLRDNEEVQKAYLGME
jgi:branched-chain amino acid transport system ATP-binding protein